MISPKEKIKTKKKKASFKPVLLVLLVMFFILLSVFFIIVKQKEKTKQDVAIPERPYEFNKEEYAKKTEITKDMLTGNIVGSNGFFPDYFHGVGLSVPGDEQIIQIFNIEASNKSYQPGEKINLEGLVKNPESYPLINVQLHGAVYRIENNQEKATQYGNHLLTDFIIWEGVDLKPQGKYKFKTSLTLPEGIPSGRYAVLLNLVQGKRFNIKGFPYIDENLGIWYNELGTLFFEIKNPQEPKFVWINKDSIELNGQQINVSTKNALLPFTVITRNDDQKMNIVFDLINESKANENVDIVYDVIRVRENIFGKLNEERRIIDKNIELNPGEKKRIQREIGIEKDGSTQAKGSFYAIAVSVILSGKEESILIIPIKIIDDSGVARIIATGINNFPIKKGDNFDLWIAFRGMTFNNEEYESGNEPKEIKIELSLYDIKGDKIGGLLYNGKADQEIRCWKNNLKAKENINYLKMEGKVYSKGFLIDEIERIYDCARIKNGNCIIEKDKN